MKNRNGDFIFSQHLFLQLFYNSIELINCITVLCMGEHFFKESKTNITIGGYGLNAIKSHWQLIA